MVPQSPVDRDRQTGARVFRRGRCGIPIGDDTAQHSPGHRFAALSGRRPPVASTLPPRFPWISPRMPQARAGDNCHLKPALCALEQDDLLTRGNGVFRRADQLTRRNGVASKLAARPHFAGHIPQDVLARLLTRRFAREPEMEKS